MAENKKSFIFYTNWKKTFEQLPKDKGYDLLMHLLSYVNDENPETDDFVINALFAQMKEVLKKDLKTYEETIETKSISGRLGNLKRWNKDLYDKIIGKEITIEDAENIAKHRKTSHSDNVQSQRIAKIADNEIEIDNDIVIDVLLEKEPKQATEEIFDFEKVWNSFQGKKNIYEKDLRNFKLKTEGLEVDFRKLFYEAKKSKNIYFQTWINDIFPKSSKKVAEKKVSEIPSLDEFWEYTEKHIIEKNLGPPEDWKIPIEAKFNAWNENGWKDGNGKQIQNWKTKIQNTIPFLRPIRNNGQFNNQSTNNGFANNSGNSTGSQSGKISARTILAQRLGAKTSGNNESGNITIDAEVVK